MKKNKRIAKNGRIVCNCERKVKLDDIVYVNSMVVYKFDWWKYDVDCKYNIKNKIIINNKRKPYAYIGCVPILREITYYIHNWLTKKEYVCIIECKYCEHT
ncbi:MAG: hypothetical protein EOL97_13765 [Spirochaetia bacterium]|nr:hypothetical protein [Spirochaetia bacterium]